MRTQLHDYRQQKQMTIHQLASEIGISADCVQRVERNIGHKNVRKILKWCTLHDINPTTVFPEQASA